ncbi:hypothetical protein J8Z82_10455 [Yersinia enterocolitica]|uniref:hypothetical protein n=1 Tax=Yersinia enterocolitica TaxID=630 RepID=UPI001C8E9BC6|nr:hypothetical protein [Yersinia enterocolitica]MBX9485951.1 hypothetical protein [Yersinia enterocolitica]MBX9492208.1 hypothetical protein [Yersinia enterocolitica]
MKKQKVRQLNDIVSVTYMSREGATPPRMFQAAVYAFFSVVIILSLYTLYSLPISYLMWVPVLVFILTLKYGWKSKSWLEDIREKLQRYDPVDKAAYQRLQEILDNPHCYYADDILVWVSKERYKLLTPLI